MLYISQAKFSDLVPLCL